jgi:hypothetical protein
MTVGVFGPDPVQAQRWSVIGVTVTHFSDLFSISQSAWNEMDIVILDMLSFRLGTTDWEVDEPLAAEAVRDAAARNPDAYWMFVTPPAIEGVAWRLVRSVAGILCGGLPATAVAKEPHAVRQFAPNVRSWIDEIRKLEALKLDFVGLRPLTRPETRSIRRLLRDTELAVLEPLGDSGGKAVAVKASCQMEGAPSPLRVLKVGPAPTIRQEHDNFMNFVRNRLGLNRHPQHDSTDVWFAGDSGALQYSFAGGQAPIQLASYMETQDATGSLTELAGDVLKPWLGMRHSNRMSLASFVRLFLDKLTPEAADEVWHKSPDPPSAPWNPIPWMADIMARPNDVDLPLVIAHGDLHPYNVLIDADGHAWLVDFYHTGRKPVPFDFAFADVALMLHRPEGRASAAVHATAEELRAGEQGYYSGGKPFRPELKVLRDFGIGYSGAGAEGYFHLARAAAALRLLSFATTDTDSAKVVASLAAARARELHPEWESRPKEPAIPL